MRAPTPQPNVLSGGGARLPLRFWCLVVVTGVGAGLGGGLLMLLLRAVQHLAWRDQGGTFLDAVRHVGDVRRVLVLLAAAVLVAMVRWLLRQGSGGHGGELTAAIWFQSGRMNPLSGLTNAILSIVVVGMGASLGREAAPKQVAAVIASTLAGWIRLPSPQRRLLVACGAGAGMAAVYNVPFGGALFALEVLLGTLSLPLVAPAFATSLIAVAVSWLLLPDRPTYTIPSFHVTPGQVVWALLAGPVAGVVSAFYVRLISWADGRKPKGRRLHGLRLLAMPLLAFGVLGALAIPFPQLLGNGKDVVQQAFDGQLGLTLLLALVVLKPLVTAACLGSGAPGGLFTPTLTLGALLGALLGQLWVMVWPGAMVGSYALIGAGAVLAATTQGPISSVALLIELTRHLDTVMVPMLLAMAGAIVTARLIETRSVYSGRIHEGQEAEKALKQEMQGRMATISAAASYAEVLRTLLMIGVPLKPLVVIDAEGRTVGEITPEVLIRPPPALVPLATATAVDFATPSAVDVETRTASRRRDHLGGSPRD